MPYIDQDKRDNLDQTIDALAEKIVQQSQSDTDFAGDLNYSITRLISKILLLKFNQFKYWHSPIIRGVLADVSDEFYRRIVSVYEDKKIAVKGDVELFIDLFKKMK